MDDFREKMAQALWTAHTLFDHQRVCGSAGNLSFLCDGVIYISASGSMFGTLCEKDFARVSLASGETLANSPKPSKELPLHRLLYLHKKESKVIVHTHSFWATLWSCIPPEDALFPVYTPYLERTLGTLGRIPFAPPGSNELFRLFEERLDRSDAYLLNNHGPVVGGKNFREVYAALEELEESAKLAWHLKDSSCRPL